MEIWPAIDLRGGKCVRLQQGDYGRETVFGDDPAAMARHWVDEGASVCTWSIWTVPASGRGQPRGGGGDLGRGGRAVRVGRRNPRRGDDSLAAGPGTAAAGDRHAGAASSPTGFARCAGSFPHKLVLGIDARDGRVATDGWLETSDVAPPSWRGRLADEPIAAIVYTDIATDGMMAGPNVPAMAAMRRRSPSGDCLRRCHDASTTCCGLAATGWRAASSAGRCTRA